MIDGADWIELVEAYYAFLIAEFGFGLVERKINGNAFYHVHYRHGETLVSVSYENVEDYLLVIVFLLQQGAMPDYDDKTRTLHLNRLNQVILPKLSREEIERNNALFSKFSARTPLQRRMLQSAKELRLCLKHSSLYNRVAPN